MYNFPATTVRSQHVRLQQLLEALVDLVALQFLCVLRVARTGICSSCCCVRERSTEVMRARATSTRSQHARLEGADDEVLRDGRRMGSGFGVVNDLVLVRTRDDARAAAVVTQRQ